MAAQGWQQLVADWPWYRGTGSYPLPAYSEFMPSPRLGRKPYGDWESFTFRNDDPYGWPVSEYEEQVELAPGLGIIAGEVMRALVALGEGRGVSGIARSKLTGNPYWPALLASHAGRLPHERFVLLMPLALSRTQDDKGRVRWTLFGNSEQGPARGFWRGFYADPDTENPAETGLNFFRDLLQRAYGESAGDLRDLRAAGFRILPAGADGAVPHWREEPLPRWTEPLRLADGEAVAAVRYLLTFRPFALLPAAIQQAYLTGSLCLLPFPGSLLFWGAAPYRKLAAELPFALQIPLLQSMARRENPRGIRIPQSGWLHGPHAGQGNHDADMGPLRNSFKRTHRWARVLRHEDELEAVTREDHIHQVLFSTHPDDVGLYGKPMARNVQLWSPTFHAVLDGPGADRIALEQALKALEGGGSFGYRFYYPPMQVGRHAVFWHRPLLAFREAASGGAVLLADGPRGYFTAYDIAKPDLPRPVELWPRLLDRELERAALEVFQHARTALPHQDAFNVRKLLETRRLLGGEPLSPGFARALLTTAKHRSFDEWLQLATAHASDAARAGSLAEGLRRSISPTTGPLPPSLTYDQTAARDFEVRYWQMIATLAEGRYLTKNNSDCIQDASTRKHLGQRDRDLDRLGDFILAHYRRAAADAGIADKVLVGDQPFPWRTDFAFPWMSGWQKNQSGELRERNLVIVIPGNDRSRAVIMADHYDTAYMEDQYGYGANKGGDGARLAAAGADDNHSATSCLMLAAPILMRMSREGRLQRDVWLVHLTGEEFPADCLGARHLCQALVEGSMQVRGEDDTLNDLSGTRVCGVYVLDMIAHNNGRNRDIFQIAPGSGRQAMWLARQAHLASEIWNAGTTLWNRQPARRGLGRGRRSPRGAIVPGVAQHLALHAEVRPHYGPGSTLFNTDGQIFSDAGVPVVLFMENYDINRKGYHDSQDTMANIDLDYGAAVAAIAIEAVARAATEPLPQAEGNEG
ncbi:MAG TPA: M28 family peptidase [Candidatus Sulfotelmatobacter sp.]|nr:M28 family peptidase [Candidatus Sulfotelmatobacter sp.]